MPNGPIVELNKKRRWVRRGKKQKEKEAKNEKIDTHIKLIASVSIRSKCH